MRAASELGQGDRARQPDPRRDVAGGLVGTAYFGQPTRPGRLPTEHRVNQRKAAHATAAAPRCRGRAALLRRVAAAVDLRVGFQSEAALARDSDEALRQRIYQARRGSALRALIYSLCAQTQP
jgi:hypothetical protein